MKPSLGQYVPPTIAVAAQRGIQSRDRLAIHFDGVVDAVRALHGERRAQRRELGLVGGEPQIAGRIVAAVAAGLVGEPAQLRAREQRQPHVDRRRELHAETAGRAPRAALAGTRGGVEHDDVAHAARGEMVRDARADHAAADHDDCLGHVSTQRNVRALITVPATVHSSSSASHAP